MLRDSDLDPLRELPEWEILLERCRDLEAKTPPPDPKPVVVPPVATGSGDGRVLVVLHAAGSRPELETEHWTAATEAGWTIIAPQSTQRLSAAGRYGWHDLERAKADVMTQLEEAGHLSEGDLVIGGFSQGAGLAAHLACGAGVLAAGLILVCPTFHWGMPEAPASGGPVATVIFLGTEERPRITEDVEKLSEIIRGVDWPMEIELLEGVGHSYPPDFHGRLARALGSIESMSADQSISS
ncbi:MAG: hypothetical protein WD156_08800 [Acidimicrobiia bacterium]